MKTLHLSIIVFLLTLMLFPFNTILAQNQNQPTIEFDQASYSTSSMSCNPYQQKITAPTVEQNKVTIIVTDPNANKFSTSIDRVVVSVWSDSDKKGIEITAYETEVNSGIFKGKVTISDGQSTQDIIHVNNGDTLSARYAGATPGSFDTTSHGITTTSFIGISCPPFERVPASSIRILDTQGNEHNVTTVGKQVLIVSNISNPTPVNQNFTYIVQIQDKNGSAASLAWLSGTMLPNQTSSPSVSWTPSKTGNYVVSIFVWQSLTNPNSLSPPLVTDLTVLHDSEIHPKSPIGTVENLHCKLGFELMIKPTDGSPVCVTPTTAQKLVHRGWGMTNGLSLGDIDNHVKEGTPIGKNIVLQKPSSMVKPFPRCNPNPTLEKLIREKQQVLTDALLSGGKKYGGFENRTQNLPWSFIGYDCVDNALEVGILPQYFTSDFLPKYFENIRSIVGNTIDIVLSPQEYSVPD